jgi:hypothetical protein
MAQTGTWNQLSSAPDAMNLNMLQKYSLLQYELQEARAASRREVFDQAPVEQGAGSAA